MLVRAVSRPRVVSSSSAEELRRHGGLNEDGSRHKQEDQSVVITFSAPKWHGVRRASPVLRGYLERHLRRLLGGALNHVSLVDDQPPPPQGREGGRNHSVPGEVGCGEVR